MIPDFDEIIDRRVTNSAKWDAMAAACGTQSDDAIAMWVADMDFRPPAAVSAALQREVTMGVHGYYTGDQGWRDAIAGWMATRHGWQVDPDWLLPTSGVINGIAAILQAYTQPGDGVVMFSPIYPGFTGIVRESGRTPVYSRMRLVQGRYEMDLEALEESLPENARVVLFCSPHNPGGRIWSIEEQRALGAFCEKHDLLLVADEIHHDLVYPGQRHIPFLTAMPELAHRTIICASPTKTFNLAGAHLAEAIVPDAARRATLAQTIRGMGMMTQNRFGMIAAEAAYAGGAAWLDALIPYLRGNRDLLAARLATELPGVTVMDLPSTYLAWVDFGATGIAPADLAATAAQKARVGVNSGLAFGPGGESWLRLNFALPRARLDTALSRLVDAFRQ